MFTRRKRGTLAGGVGWFALAALTAALVLSPAIAPGQDSYKVGVVFPLSGDLATYGKSMQNGALLAQEEINAAGGIDGKPLELVFEDGLGTPAGSLKGLNKLINVDKVPVVFGPAVSTNFLAVAPRAEQMRTVLISSVSTSPRITEAGEYIFRVIPSDALQGKAMAQFAADLGYTEVAVLYLNNDYGVGLAGAFVAAFEAQGGKVTEKVAFNEGGTDFRTELRKVAGANPPAIAFVAYVKEAGIILKQAYELAIDSRWIASEGIKAQEVIDLLGAELAEGIVGTFPAQVQAAEFQAFKEAWVKKFGGEPTIFGEYTYDMTKITAQAIRVGGYTADGIKEALDKVVQDYRGASGLKTLDANGDVGNDLPIDQLYHRWMYHDGKVMDYDPAALH